MPQPALADLLRETLAQLRDCAGPLASTAEQALARQLAAECARLAAPEAASPRPADTLKIHFEYALSGIVESTREGTLVAANAAAASILGQDRSSLVGTSLPALVSPVEHARMSDFLRLLAEQGIAHIELSSAIERGARRLVFSSILAREDLCIHFIDDVTEDRALAAELVEARNAAQAADAAKGRFLANISHEIRTPLNGVIGLAQLALMDCTDGAQEEVLGKILRSGKTLLAILNDLLDFSKIEADKMVLERRLCDWHAVLEELADTGARSLAEKPVELLFHVQPAVPRYFVTDPLRLTQILLNLLGNAVKFTAQGQIRLTLGLEGYGAEQVLVMEVSDTGPGIAGDTLERLFEPFAQGDVSTTRQFGGTGLGLAISHQLARGLGGALTVESAPGKGSLFRLSLPLESGSPGTAPVGDSLPGPVFIWSSVPDHEAALIDLVHWLGGSLASTTEASLCLVSLATVDELADALEVVRGRTVPLLLLVPRPCLRTLVERIGDREDITIVASPLTPQGLLRAGQGTVGPAPGGAVGVALPGIFSGVSVAVAEDDELNAEVIRGLLRHAGVEVLLAPNGRALLASLARASTLPALILMDIHMPEMDGLEAARRLREQGFESPIIALSAGISVAERADCLAAGMNDFLAKPIDLDALWGILTRWLPPAPAPVPVSAVTDAAPASQVPRWLVEAGLDVDDALPRYLGRGAALEGGVRTFCRWHGEPVASLEDAWRRDDPQTFRASAHALRGAAATIGARTLAELCRQAEGLVDDGFADRAGELLASIRQASARITAAAASGGGDENTLS